MPSFNHDVIIVGAGAAGLFCAITAAKRGLSVVVLDHAEKVGKKILISGGGRCNFTNLHSGPHHFISNNPHFCKSALTQYPPSEFIALVKKHGIHYHEKKLGQLFCDEKSQAIVDLLLLECHRSGVSIMLNESVSKIRHAGRFELTTAKNMYLSQTMVIATGGLSIPKMGATDLGYRVAKQFGHTLIPPEPALVPLLWRPAEKSLFSEISGVSAEIEVSCLNVRFRENFLFTHKGLSGPAILQISSYWNTQEAITINLLPDKSIETEINKRKSDAVLLSAFFNNFFPKSLAQALAKKLEIQKTLPHLSKAEIQQISDSIHRWKLSPAGTEGFDKAEVTKGGVNTDELSSKTMESKKQKGLYFIGEVVDVTGHLGGHNFQWAWSSGFAAGNHL